MFNTSVWDGMAIANCSGREFPKQRFLTLLLFQRLLLIRVVHELPKASTIRKVWGALIRSKSQVSAADLRICRLARLSLDS